MSEGGGSLGLAGGTGGSLQQGAHDGRGAEALVGRCAVGRGGLGGREGAEPERGRAVGPPHVALVHLPQQPRRPCAQHCSRPGRIKTCAKDHECLECDLHTCYRARLVACHSHPHHHTLYPGRIETCVTGNVRTHQRYRAMSNIKKLI